VPNQATGVELANFDAGLLRNHLTQNVVGEQLTGHLAH